MFKHIFVTTDGSPCGDAALPLAAGLADTCGAALTVAYVVPDLLAGHEGPYVRDYVQELAEAQEQGRSVLRRAATARPGTQTVLLDSRASTVARSLLRGAQTQGADLIVMSTHGRSGLGRLLLGSVAEEVTRHAAVPVLLVRAGDPAPQTSSSEAPA
ncbi:universal stress protein [Deinococcus multiflagellatus]|uniref:Universal stress protein n=1 Tax=Deinococcus multiflagellatus TaxID=1656887 RepID=A0ABW1ZS05_9DEIO|nr:universal stress protein [Deinococcus multiflagellatus]MBZ9713566.1 universal stress protein [Deinococcus multiflagellatus]